jgi:hypothetical protein
MSLRDHYLRTTYRVTGVDPPIDIRIGEPCPALDALLEKHGVRCWAFITAWNPGSKRLDDAENRRRQARLEADVEQGGHVFYRGAGVPDDFVGRGSESSIQAPRSSSGLPDPAGAEWRPEISILIAGLDHGAAVALGRKFDQAAIVFGEAGNKAELVFI